MLQLRANRNQKIKRNERNPEVCMPTINIQKQEEDNKYPEILTDTNDSLKIIFQSTNHVLVKIKFWVLFAMCHNEPQTQSSII